MTKRIVTWATLFAVFVSAVPWECVAAQSFWQVAAIEAAEKDSIPASEPSSCADACGDDCQCLCCPGHGAMLAWQEPKTAIAAAISPSSVFEDDLHSSDTLEGVFHPPRVV